MMLPPFLRSISELKVRLDHEEHGEIFANFQNFDKNLKTFSI